ncbi:hypothetical protein [Persicobacter sp. CCB-QB2]|uniref:hypothetical protein n=1 Tax=Persicobacter sp. CCB-QB2 TaxID=1561025 RepID=UPI0006A97524|nr:hypothetical protein [Persicobacter sp. CCB-QB2]
MLINTNTLLKIILKSQVIVGLVGCAILMFGLNLLNISVKEVGWTRFVFVFTACVLIYRIEWVIHKFGVGKGLSMWISGKGLESRIFYPLLILVLLLSFFLGRKEWWMLFHLGVISLLYNFPSTLPVNFKPWRSVPFLKVFLIAYVWAMLGSYYPATFLEIPLQSEGLFQQFACLFFYVFGMTLPFDIRDYYTDQRQQLWTIAGAIGIPKTKILAMVSLSLFCYMALELGISSWWLGLTFLLSLVLVGLANPLRSSFYYNILMDGSILLFLLGAVFWA